MQAMYITCANSFHILRARNIHPTYTSTVLRICTPNTYIACTSNMHKIYT